ncbi:DUF3793 family protein [Cellulosilyticum ruminicola]|uniref:DUF3793 family protein n=1 Tax=Cellulosilyticum ruminicola TaxID=425254 RepID=UPI0006CFC792|nr:DUF3793 family protein [Cellulosilyticum ruminicola]
MKNKRLVFYRTIKGLDDKMYLKYSLKYQLAPVIMGFKPGMTINLPREKYEKDWASYSEYIESELQIKSAVLRYSNKSIIIFFYRNCLIEDLLQDKEIRLFLKQFAYDTTSVIGAVKHLQKRYNEEHCPHELGVLLGIDLKDVQDYIQCPDKECLLCSYWKVYNNVEIAKITFANFDLAKSKMLNSLLEELKVA